MLFFFCLTIEHPLFQMIVTDGYMLETDLINTLSANWMFTWANHLPDHT